MVARLSIMQYFFMQSYQWIVHPKFNQLLNRSHLQQTGVNQSYTVPMTSFLPAVKIDSPWFDNDLEMQLWEDDSRFYFEIWMFNRVNYLSKNDGKAINNGIPVKCNELIDRMEAQD